MCRVSQFRPSGFLLFLRMSPWPFVWACMYAWGLLSSESCAWPERFDLSWHTAFVSRADPSIRSRVLPTVPHAHVGVTLAVVRVSSPSACLSAPIGALFLAGYNGDICGHQAKRRYVEKHALFPSGFLEGCDRTFDGRVAQELDQGRLRVSMRSSRAAVGHLWSSASHYVSRQRWQAARHRYLRTGAMVCKTMVFSTQTHSACDQQCVGEWH